MKNILLFAVILTFASCSDQVYSYRHKIKVNRETVTQTPPSSPDLSSGAAGPAEEVITADASVESSIPPGYLAAPVIPGIHVNSKGERAGVKQATTVKPHKVKQLMKAIDKKLTLKKESVYPSSENAMSASPRSLIIVGLVVLLIGIVLYIVSGVLGWVFTSIGAILIVVGLILYLLDVL